ncbi:uncharacterized protein LOC132736703 [Ruditapes philippinarum]|uniref:uncharacterized protein LOC132736703 n=1 Tax=Ruditapes philippinarum TaxID=129788 RepID=UPI00295B1AF8|nr:uncharacterized protein LOC132736703 [Ruditapes philippinarum]
MIVFFHLLLAFVKEFVTFKKDKKDQAVQVSEKYFIRIETLLNAIRKHNKDQRHSSKGHHTRRIMYQDLYSDSDSDDGFVLSSETSSGLLEDNTTFIPEPHHVNIPEEVDRPGAGKNLVPTTVKQGLEKQSLSHHLAAQATQHKPVGRGFGKGLVSTKPQHEIGACKTKGTPDTEGNVKQRTASSKPSTGSYGRGRARKLQANISQGKDSVGHFSSKVQDRDDTNIHGKVVEEQSVGNS